MQFYCFFFLISKENGNFIIHGKCQVDSTNILFRSKNKYRQVPTRAPSIALQTVATSETYLTDLWLVKGESRPIAYMNILSLI